MEHQIHKIQRLAEIDKRLDELMEDYGDLPEQLKVKEKHYQEKKSLVDETESILGDIKRFVSKTKVTLVDLKEKEEKLAKQQFNVRNNKEFDAITSEIAHIKEEHEKLSDKMRTEGVKQENLNNILQQQIHEMDKAKKDLDEKKVEVQKLAGDQKSELKKLNEEKDELTSEIKVQFMKNYGRIRTIHKDAAVLIWRNSCSGCFSAIPQQIIVDVRNNLDSAYFCENCGRILLPEDESADVEEVL
jgi:predicted  nucleic acid-binding Zn-ribbon protein